MSLLIFLTIFTACGQEEPAPHTPEPSTAQPTQTPQPTRTVSPTATPTVTPTPISPSISVGNQIIDNSSQVLIDRVTLDGPGWIAIKSDDDGAPGHVIGFSQIDPLVTNDIMVQIDPKLATSLLHAALYLDQGITGVFEFPGPDSPVRFNGEEVSASFTVDNRASLPSLTVSDQNAGEDSLVTIEALRTQTPGYLAIHNDEGGEPGEILAYVPVDSGLIRDLSIRVNSMKAAPLLHAVLYEDKGVIGRFDPNVEDPVVRVLDQPISSSFSVQFPPEIFVYEQPIINESIEIEKAVSYGPGWLVVYNDDEGTIGLIIAWAALEDGINERIKMTINPSAATPLLHLMIHEDRDDLGQFEFPRTDPAVLVENRVPNPYTLRIDGGNYLITEDQRLEESNISVPLVIVDENAWVVVRGDSDGEPGDIIGRSWVEAGVSHDVQVALEDEPPSDLLHVLLHLDGGISQIFEFPDGVDIPLQRNRAVISAPMLLLSDSES